MLRANVCILVTPAFPTSVQAAAHINIGNLLHFLGDHTDAVSHYKKGIELSEECGDMVSYAWAHENLGNMYPSLPQHKEALHYLQWSLELMFVHECTPVAIGCAHNNLISVVSCSADWREREGGKERGGERKKEGGREGGSGSESEREGVWE